MKRLAVVCMALLAATAVAGCLDGDSGPMPDTWTITVTYAGDYTPTTNITVRHDPSKSDTDGDGISDYDEWFSGGGSGKPTNASNPDTDGDGIPDGMEVEMGTDPTDWRHDVDHDNGNWRGDYEELMFYRNHYNISNETSLQFLRTDDVDGDGVRDGFDIDPLTDLAITLTIHNITITSDMDESDGRYEIQFQLVTDATAISGGEETGRYDVIQNQNNQINYEFTADLDDTGTPGEYNNSIALTVIDHDDIIGERKPGEAVTGDRSPEMDFVRIDGNGSYVTDHFDIRSDCHSYMLHGQDGTIWFTIEDASEYYD
ncbi:MAG: hypothetical protein ACP5FL_02685 [Thermoplasmatota archaeon]